MSFVTENKAEAANLVSILSVQLKRNEPQDFITWLMLGGVNFMPLKPTSSFDFVLAGSKGIPKLSVFNLSVLLGVPMKDMANLLYISYKTLGRKKNTDLLSSLASSLTIEIADTITKGLYVFEDATKLNRWLHKENKALNGNKPFDLLNTPTGIKLVNQILGRIGEGVYS